MNICFVYDCEYPWDIRVEKICKSLIREGNHVSLICRNKNADPDYDELGGLKIYRLPHGGRKFFTKCINVTIFFNPVWIIRIHRVVCKERSQLIIVRDLPLALSGIIIGKLKGIPVVVDMAEPYPLTVRQRRKYESFKVYHIITRNYLFADILERAVIKTADHIFAVCEEAKHRLIARGINPQKITIIRNAPGLHKFNASPPSYPGVLNKLKGQFVILYVGLIIGGRGIDMAIKAMKEVSGEKPDIKLVIIGNGKLENEMREFAQRLELQDSVFFEGWVDHNRVPEYMNSCDLGLLPFVNSEHMNHTLANKIFDFMAIGKSILCSDVKPMKRIIQETGAGYLFEAGNHVSLRDMILKTYKEDSLKEKGKDAIEFVQRKYNWELEENKMQRVFKGLLR